MGLGTYPTNSIIEEYLNIYQQVYNQEARAYYIGSQWYQVNGKALHQTLMVREINRLKDLAHMKLMRQSKKGAVQRLIAKLRLL